MVFPDSVPPKQHPLVGVMGRYVTRNFGDQLIRRIIEKELRSIGARPYVLWAHERTTLKGLPHKISQRLHSPIQLSVAGAVDHGIFGGGGYLNDGKDWKRLIRYWEVASIWRISSIPYQVLGVGVGPIHLRRSAAMIREICEGAQVVTVRDDESRRLLQQSGVTGEIHVTSDWALLLADAYGSVTYSNRSDQRLRTFGIHLQLNEISRRSILSVAAHKLNTHYSRSEGNIGVAILFDEPMAPSVVEATKDHAEAIFRVPVRVVPYEGVLNLLNELAKLDGVLTNKLHTGIAAWAMGVPPCSYSSHEKTKRFYKQIGREAFQADVGAPLEDSVRNWIRAFVEDGEAYSVEHPGARELLIGGAKENARLLNRGDKPVQN